MSDIEIYAAYLPYGLKVEIPNGRYIRLMTIDNVRNDEVYLNKFDDSFYSSKVCKPLLFPLECYKDINSKEMCDIGTNLFIQIEINKLSQKSIGIRQLSVSTYKCCLENMIDIFNLIPQEKAIDARISNAYE